MRRGPSRKPIGREVLDARNESAASVMLSGVLMLPT